VGAVELMYVGMPANFQKGHIEQCLSILIPDILQLMPISEMECVGSSVQGSKGPITAESILLVNLSIRFRTAVFADLLSVMASMNLLLMLFIS
jgi:hypothetical protein